MTVCYKKRQKFIKNASDFLLQNSAVLLQNVTFITNYHITLVNRGMLETGKKLLTVLVAPINGFVDKFNLREYVKRLVKYSVTKIIFTQNLIAN